MFKEGETPFANIKASATANGKTVQWSYSQGGTTTIANSIDEIKALAITQSTTVYAKLVVDTSSFEGKASEYRAKSGEVEKFLFFTDAHYITAEENGTWNNTALDKLDIMAAYYNKFAPSFAISGGDFLNDSNSRQNAIDNLVTVKATLKSLFGEVYIATGNHDYNYQTKVNGNTTQSSQELTLQERIDAWYSEYGSTYYTFEGENTKFYLFDTGKDWGHGDVTEYDIEQIIWFLEGLEANDDKHIAMVAHIVYMNETVVHPAVLKYTEISKAYNERKTGD
jgi:hypothetical protein